jgi:hypothetical protein
MLRRIGETATHWSPAVPSVALLGWLVYTHLSIFGTPGILCIPEAAYVNNIGLMAAGGNPYALEHLPEHTQVYGLAYNLALLPLTLLIGTDVLALRAVNFVLLYLSSILLWVTLVKRGLPIAWGLGCTVLWLSHMLRDTTLVYAGPDVFGTFLYLIAMLLPVIFGFTRSILAICVLIWIAEFHVKMYFSFAAVSTLSFMFLRVSKSRAILVGGGSFVGLVLSVVVLDELFPTYRLLCVDFILLWVAPVLVTWDKFVQQNTSYVYINSGLLLVSIAMLTNWLQSLRQRDANRRTRWERDGKFDLRHWRRPVLEKLDVGFLEWSVACTALFMLYVGAAESETRFYHELLTPLLLLTAIPWAYKQPHALARPAAACALIIGMLLSNVTVTGKTNFEHNISQLNSMTTTRTEPQRRNWEMWESLLATAERPMVPIELSPILISQGKKAHDVGHCAVYLRIAAETVEDSAILSHYQAYEDRLRQRVSVADYDLVILRGGASDYIPLDLLKSRYQLIENRPFVMNQGSYPMAVWRPIPETQP